MRRVAIGCALLAAAVAAILAVQSGQEPVLPAVTPSGPEVGSQPATVNLQQAGRGDVEQASAWPQNAARHDEAGDRGGADLLAGYVNARSARAFIHAAMQRPESGGAYYATLVIRHCGGASFDSGDAGMDRGREVLGAESDGMAHRERAAAVDRMTSLCGDVSAADLAAWQAHIASIRASGKDPLLNAQQKIIDAKVRGSPEMRAAIGDVIASGNPILISEIGPRLFLPATGSKVRFNGREVDLTGSPVLLTALSLLPCELGIACSAGTDISLDMACAYGNACHDSRLARAKAEMTDLSDALLQQSVALAKELADAVRARNVAAFVPE